MAFVQITEFRTSQIDEVTWLGDAWESATGTDSGVTRRLLCADRNSPGRYLNVVFFDSYEAAVENSNLSVTHDFSQRMVALCDSPPTFSDLDVVEDKS